MAISAGGPSGGDDDLFSAPMSDMNVTPMVDVMLVLLIVFMVAAPLMMVGVPLQLPRTCATRVALRRAEPLPPIPADVAGNTIKLTVPISFRLQG